MHFVAYAISETISNPPGSYDVSGVCNTDRLQAATTRHRTTSYSKASVSLPVHRGILGCLPALHKNWCRSCQCEISFSQVRRSKMRRKYHYLSPHLFSVRVKPNRPILKFLKRGSPIGYVRDSVTLQSTDHFLKLLFPNPYIICVSTFSCRYLNCHIQPEPVILHALGINITEVS